MGNRDVPLIPPKADINLFSKASSSIFYVAASVGKNEPHFTIKKEEEVMKRPIECPVQRICKPQRQNWKRVLRHMYSWCLSMEYNGTSIVRNKNVGSS